MGVRAASNVDACRARSLLLIVDLESTCWETSRLPNGEHQNVENMEIIELGCALAFHDMAFEGQTHRGVDYARNIVRLLPFMDWALEPELLN